MKFQKRPVVIEAVRYGKDDDGSWYPGAVLRVALFIAGLPSDQHLTEAQILEYVQPMALWNPPDEAGLLLSTLEGTGVASLGDWIIKGVQGEFYPCKPDIFEATYDEVTE